MTNVAPGGAERGEARSSGPPYQTILDGDSREVPAPLRASSYRFVDEDAIRVDRYTSRSFHELEAERLWGDVWQMACRLEHLANVGDHIVYEVCDLSLVLVRVGPTEVRAFHNSCLHRGTTLVEGAGNAAFFRCPFHGFAWNLDGTFRAMPAAWDFPHVDKADFCLPEAAVAVWGGWVFVHPGPNPEPFESFSEPLSSHFAPYSHDDRYVAFHACQVIDANWKVTQEAFLEGYHIPATHPHTIRWANDHDMQYDVFSPNVSRLLQALAVPSTGLVGTVTQDEIARSIIRMVPVVDRDAVPDDVDARSFLAEQFRRSLGRQWRVDLSGTSDAEMLDSIQYALFPNFGPWGGFALPLTYRYRPWGDDPNRSLMEVMLLHPIPLDGQYSTADPFWLEPGQSWTAAPGFESLGMVFDQDMANLARIQRGLRAARHQTIVLSEYQEIRIRSFHRRLDEQLGLR